MTLSGVVKTPYQISLSKNIYSYDQDVTEDYQNYVIKDILPNETGVIVSKVIVTYTYI